ncbi:hypothetical protein GS502_15205 [Rhodococcus hoagii]|nr:hypothetical protein [Prescottella equi]
MYDDPSLLQVATTLGGPALVHQLRQLFDLDEDLEPTGDGFLHHFGCASVFLGNDVPAPDAAIPEAVLDLAFDARTIHRVNRFIETTEDQFQILGLLEPDGVWDRFGLGRAAFQYSQVERTLIWDDPSSGSDTNTQTVLHGLLYLALLSGDSRVLQQRLSIASAIIGGKEGKLARLHTDEISQHEMRVHILVQQYLRDPVRQRDILRQTLRDIVDGRLTSVGMWHDPVFTYREYQKKLFIERAQTGRRQGDPRYRGGFTLEDLHSQSRIEELYGSRTAYLDEERLGVLDEIIDYFGKDKCTLMRGEFDTQHSLDLDTSVIDKSYVILAVRARDEGPWQEDAIAISPFAGAHAVYYVRSDVSRRSWQDVLATGKFWARAAGARSLRFRSGGEFDEYEAMTWKLQALSRCSTTDFATGRVTYDSLTMEYRVT